MTPLTADERLQRLEDRVALQELVAAYGFALDERDLERYLSLFTSDAVLRHRDGVMRLEGLPAIRDYYSERFAGYGVTVHTPHAHSITFESPDSASGVVAGYAEMSQDGELFVAAIRYADRYRRLDGRWLFAERELAFWYYVKLSDLPHAFADNLRKHYRGRLLPAELPESLDSYRAWHGRPDPLGG